MEELTNFEKFLRLAKSEHERQNKEANNLEKRLSAIEENLGKLKDVVEKITRLSFVAQTIQKIEGTKKEREFPKTFQEVLSILRTAAEDDVNNCLYLLWNRIYPLFVNQTVFAEIKQEIATLRCMLITRAINMVDDSDYSWAYYLDFTCGNGGQVYGSHVKDRFARVVPNVLVFKSEIGANNALKYFKNEWMEMFTDSK